MLHIQNLDKSYTNPKGNVKREILKNLNLHVKQGESIAIVGPSGSGKTTLLNLIAQLDKADSGSIFINDKETGKLSPGEILAFRNQEIGIVFQLHHLLPQCTLMENVLIPTIINKDEQSEQRAEKLLKRLGLWEIKNQFPGEMSGGECQRAAVVRAMINEPGLLLADEPTGSLDGEHADKLADLLLELNKSEGVTLVVVTHSPEIARRMSKTYKLNEGQLEEIQL